MYISRFLSLGPEIIVKAYDPDKTIPGACVSALVILVVNLLSRELLSEGSGAAFSTEI